MSSQAGSTERVDAVTFSNDDIEDCRNWSKGKKNFVTFQVAMLCFAAGFGSPLFAPAEIQLIERFHVNQETADSGLAVFVLGFSFGPLFCSPMSELYGRRLPYLISWPLLIVCTIPSAFANNVAVIIVFRFLSGCFAACASNNGFGLLNDLFNHDVQARNVAMAWVTIAFCAGPCLSLPIGFFVVADAGPNFWILRMYFIFTACLLPLVLALPETHGPTILANRSKKMRKSGILNARAAHESQHLTVRQIYATHVLRPALMAIREPIVQGSSIWMTLTTALIYLFFEIYPTVFLQQHNFSLQLVGLPFLSLFIGFFMGIILMPILTKIILPMRFPSFLQPPNVTPTSPEAIMKVSLIACALMPVSLFWFAWTSGAGVHWIVPTLSGIPFAISTLLITLTFVNYLSHTYTIYTNSAGACTSFFRSIIGAVLTISSHKILSSLGSKWGVSLFGFLSLGLLPIPMIFLRFGESMRAKSYYAREASSIVANMKKTEQMAGLEDASEKPASLTSALNEV
ncbi:MFS general substrate transporter [Schizopora paradoxa]|uniref:MFS general substrate transporter n=1 Tax=Schizopora paradoxa TaxID=27342 RepID=A0A0H2R490_9AGAM|nr:MFS general substrate transporter [Schizopora paradoxa]